MRFASCFLVLAACGPVNPPVSETGEGGSSAGTTSGASGETAGTAVTGPPTSGFSGEGGSGSDPGLCGDGLCGRFWVRWEECGLDGTVDGCPCFSETGEKCVAAWDELIACFESTTCAEIVADGEGPCWVAYSRAYEQCTLGEGGCELFMQIGGPNDGTCAFGEDCIDQPEKLVECGAETCTCTIAGKVVGMCPADGVCDDFAAQSAEKVAACCGA